MGSGVGSGAWTISSCLDSPPPMHEWYEHRARSHAVKRKKPAKLPRIYPLFTRTRAMVRLSVSLVLLSLGTAAAMREPRAMRIERPEDLRAKRTPPAPPAPTTPAPARLGPSDDLVLHLPGYGPPPAPQYSGFLDASAAEPGTKLHYWFAQAEREDAASRPTVLWLNGGPGSSSILGFLQENGPLLINRTGGLMRNPWAWTKEANLVALESPAGVGYSYCEASLGGGSCANSDNSTASAALAGLIDFFQNKFPTLAANEFFITGESYAGVYVPTLARWIIDHNAIDGSFKIPLTGVAAGDPCTDNAFQADSMDMLWYGHKYGFVPDEDFDTLWNRCSVRYGHPRLTTGTRVKTRDGWKGDAARPRVKTLSDGSGSFRALDAAIDPPECVAAHRRFLLATSDGFSQTWRNAWMNDLTLYGPSAVVRDDVPGTLDFDMASWMRRADVRAALHVEESPAKSWPGPDDGWTYTSQWGACNEDAAPGTPSMVDFYRYVAPRLPGPTIVFNGDTDPCVSYEGTREAVRAVGFAGLAGGAQRPYFFNASGVPLGVLDEKPLLFGPSLAVPDAGAQFGGHVTSYAEGLSFVTVHGSGHMVPQFRPRVGLHLLKKLLSGDAFAPPFKPDDELAAMTEGEFKKEMDAWTLRAQSEEFIA